MSKSSGNSYTIDLEERDPNGINSHLRTNMADVFAEHDARSFGFVWLAVFYTFTYSRDALYKLLTLFVGIPLAFVCGLSFAVISFEVTWFMTPALHIASIFMNTSRKIVQLFVNVTLVPLYEAVAIGLSKINIRFVHVYETTPGNAHSTANANGKLLEPINYNNHV